MARQRGGGFKPPELRGALGTLLRNTLQQAGVVRDVLERGAREGRAKFDEVRAGRRRTDALAELGEIVLALIRKGEIDPEELPEVREIVAHLDDIDGADGDHADHDHHDHDHDHGDHDHDHADHSHDRATVAMPTSRARFDDRSTTFSALKPAARPEPKSTMPGSTRRRANVTIPREREDDDTVSATTGRHAAPPPKPAPRVWRPVNEPPAPHDDEPTRPPPFRTPSGPMAKKGGITFGSDADADDDADLHEYMNPADVPATDPKSDPHSDPDPKP